MTESENSEEPKPWVDYQRRREIFEQEQKEIAEAAKLERKNQLKKEVEQLFVKIATDYENDRQEVEELKTRLFSAIEETYSAKHEALINVEETKSEILNAMGKAFEGMSAEFQKKLDLVNELLTILKGLQVELEKATERRDEQYKMYVEAMNEANRTVEKLNNLGIELQKQYNQHIQQLNLRARG